MAHMAKTVAWKAGSVSCRRALMSAVRWGHEKKQYLTRVSIKDICYTHTGYTATRYTSTSSITLSSVREEGMLVRGSEACLWAFPSPFGRACE